MLSGMLVSGREAQKDARREDEMKKKAENNYSNPNVKRALYYEQSALKK